MQRYGTSNCWHTGWLTGSAHQPDPQWRDIDDDDDKVLNAVLGESRSMAPAGALHETLMKDQPPDEMSEGIMSALAKLRECGGRTLGN